MLKTGVVLAAVTAAAAVALAPTASAAPGGSSADAVRGARCVQAGVRFLLENKLLGAAALRQIDYDVLDSDGGGDAGLINADLPAGSFLPLGTVIRLHFTKPELFDWCASA